LKGHPIVVCEKRETVVINSEGWENGGGEVIKWFGVGQKRKG